MSEPMPATALKITGQKLSIIDHFKQVITTEKKALKTLGESLNHDQLERAIAILSKKKGKIVVSGMGKSGHIANKIAATMASVGQSSFYVHPAEASHGDLGMIESTDVVLLLSHSGETSELKNILDYCKRLKIPVISICSNPQSTLALYSDVCLAYPQVVEACPMNLAPTTSTIMMLALGDALAITLMQLQNFDSKNFKTFHPGGKLGQQLRTVGDIMHRGKKIPLIEDTTTMDQALVSMSAFGFGCVGIITPNKELLGAITDGDLRRHMDQNFLQKNVTEVMSKNPITIIESKLLAEALAIMQEKNITSLFVTSSSNGKVTGFLHIHDCLRAHVA